MTWLSDSRLAPYTRGEDYGEGFEAEPATYLNKTLTLPSPLQRARRPVLSRSLDVLNHLN